MLPCWVLYKKCNFSDIVKQQPTIIYYQKKGRVSMSTSETKSNKIFGMTPLELSLAGCLGVLVLILFGFAIIKFFPDIRTSSLNPPPISDLTQTSVASYLNGVGVTCNPIHSNDPYGYWAICDGKSSDGSREISVEIYSHEQDKYVYQILVVLYYPNGYSEQVGSGLAYLASIPYEGSDPVQASSWVLQNIKLAEEKPTKTFGGIPYELSCNYAVTAKCITIGQEPK